MVAIISPMFVGVKPDTPIDWARFRQLLDFHVDNGTAAIVAVGTTGESATLSEQEHCDAIGKIVAHINGRLPVIAGTGANSTREAIKLTECARKAGADACLLVTPYYNKPTQEGLYQHHKAVAEAVKIPQILYNVPGRTACDMLPATIARLAKLENIIGVKEATGEVGRVAQLRSGCGEDFLLLSGDDATGREFMLAGGDGVISVTANVAPRAMADLCRAALSGDAVRAADIDEKLAMLHQELFCESNPIPVKWAIHAMGLADAGIRLPLTWASSEARQRVSSALTRAGIEHERSI
ncbi:MAG: 4-hydroxy-tetrahydrodipicolinate synthase [Proteobacteria bacterium]|nr:4-hydroxy-tetrahydrodipicolinate synthase [Pseudomonadota bacterium]